MALFGEDGEYFPRLGQREVTHGLPATLGDRTGLRSLLLRAHRRPDPDMISVTRSGIS